MSFSSVSSKNQDNDDPTLVNDHRIHETNDSTGELNEEPLDPRIQVSHLSNFSI